MRPAKPRLHWESTARPAPAACAGAQDSTSETNDSVVAEEGEKNGVDVGRRFAAFARSDAQRNADHGEHEAGQRQGKALVQLDFVFEPIGAAVVQKTGACSWPTRAGIPGWAAGRRALADCARKRNRWPRRLCSFRAWPNPACVSWMRLLPASETAMASRATVTMGPSALSFRPAARCAGGVTSAMKTGFQTTILPGFMSPM